MLSDHSQFPKYNHIIRISFSIARSFSIDQATSDSIYYILVKIVTKINFSSEHAAAYQHGNTSSRTITEVKQR